ncbi:2-acylglycerol O-acyltransferase 1-like [Contarinia nasturtii]|uniref:2-acylglycerol O-acyltransferase 1-like n=1 Tax=Contarinia nasturtii TaxID=265458 RepID=UPI0012D3DC98|nr:2-acylglycerol O-acyltransferase 1-like [Contarinia nasturtii]
MGMQWTPWFNVPCHCRLEVLSLTFFFLCVILLGPLSVILIIYLLIAGNIFWKIICVSYLVFFVFDFKSGDRGGRGAGSSWVRSWSVWKHIVNYFPIDLVKTVDLPPDRNYLICIFPHGMLSFGAAGNFCTSHSKFSTLFPGLRPKLTTLNVPNFVFPIARELGLAVGNCAASPTALTNLLTQSTDPNHKSNRDGYKSNAIGLIVGGVREQRLIFPNTYRLYLKNRKGFVKIALKTGAPLVPALSFGENDYYNMPFSPDVENPSVWQQLSGICGGRGYLQYNFGMLPRRQPITTVIGAPIEVEQVLQPNQDQIDNVHKVFCTRLEELFEEHKSKYVENFDNVHLEFV